MVRPELVLSSWKTIREDAAQAVEDFSAQDLSFRATPDLMSFGEAARHILEAGHALSGLLLAGVDDMTAPDFREKMGQLAAQIPKTEGPGALAREMRSALDASIAKLSAQPAEFFSGEITRFDGQRVTRLEMLQFIKEHELTHRSLLFLYLRLKGIVPPTTRRRMKAKA